MHYEQKAGEEGHMELDKVEARQADEHTDNGPPLVVGTLAITVIFAVLLAVFWYIRTH